MSWHCSAIAISDFFIMFEGTPYSSLIYLLICPFQYFISTAGAHSTTLLVINAPGDSRAMVVYTNSFTTVDLCGPLTEAVRSDANSAFSRPFEL